MASSSQHRCVFVGNIPYDATEEQLIEICQEVGPVVSFRLVIDRETGKPKGYGFCEYKDEETALSARRNLQGYEINGRQLRVDFAENDKGSDRNREQGRGGPGFAANADSQKQVGGPGESARHQPIGLHLAITAATMMAGALGGAQVGIQNGPQVPSTQASDPLTLHLAKMSRNQLTEIISELKAMATQNKKSARQLLTMRPELAKALFQAEIMLGLVPHQVLQTINIRQGASQPSRFAPKDVPPNPQSAVPAPGLPPVAPTMPGLMPRSIGPHGSFIHNQFSGLPQHPVQAQNSLPPQANSYQQGVVPGPSGSLVSLPVRPKSTLPSASSATQQGPSSSLHLARQSGAADMRHRNQMVVPNMAMQPSLLPQPSIAEAAFQPGASISSGISGRTSMDAGRFAQVPQEGSSIHRGDPYSNMPGSFAENTGTVRETADQTNLHQKMIKVEDGRDTSVSGAKSDNIAGYALPQSGSLKPVAKAEGQNTSPQPQLPPEVESVLLEQVMNLTPEQLSSLPPDQKQQVIHLQQMLRRDQSQLS